MTSHHVRTVVFSLSTLLLWGQAGCVAGQCTVNEDCGDGEVCDIYRATCVVPECTEDSLCGTGQLCYHYYCVDGCLDNEDCEEGQLCHENRCVEVDESCTCPLAQSFCAQDLNPASSTSGQEVCVADGYPGGVGLFFGSMTCSHCLDLFDALVERSDELAEEGFITSLLWVQLRDRETSASQIAERLGAVDAAVVQDTEQLSIWERYASNWYHFILVDTHGCLVGHWGPLYTEDVRGSLGDEIVAEWREAMSPECPAESQ